MLGGLERLLAEVWPILGNGLIYQAPGKKFWPNCPDGPNHRRSKRR